MKQKYAHWYPETVSPLLIKERHSRRAGDMDRLTIYGDDDEADGVDDHLESRAEAMLERGTLREQLQLRVAEDAPSVPARLPDSIPLEFRCPLTLDAMRSPVRLLTSVRASYERDALEYWLELQPTRDPLTNCTHDEPLQYEPNTQLKQAICAWRKELGLPELTLSTPRRSGLRRPQGVKHCLAMLRRADPAVVEAAARDLAELCEWNDSDRVAARKLGALDVLLELVRGSSSSESTRAAAARALGQLARNGDNRYFIANAGGIQPMVRMVLSQSVACQEAGALALWRMARTYKTWIAVAVEPLIGLLRERAAVAPKLYALKALWRLSVTEQHRHAIAKAGGLPKLVKLVDARGGSMHAAQVASWTLFNIACTADRSLRARVCRALGLPSFVILPNLAGIRRHLDRRLVFADRSRRGNRAVSSMRARPSGAHHAEATTTSLGSPPALARSVRHLSLRCRRPRLVSHAL